MEALSIYERMSGILGDLPAIGKNSKAPAQMGGYAFRGIDDVLNALNPLLATWGVFFVPHVLERVEGLRQTSGSKALYVVNLHVRFTFYGPLGDFVECSTWGEGTDTGDKATNKAMTAAMKYALFQTFAISTLEMEDSDAATVEDSRPVKTLAQAKAERRALWGDKPLPEGWSTFDEFDDAHETFKLGIKVLNAEQYKKLAAYRSEKQCGYPMTRDEFDLLCNYINEIRGQDETGFAPVEGGESQAVAPDSVGV